MQAANWKEYVDSGVSEGIVAVEGLEGRRVVAVVLRRRMVPPLDDEVVEGNPGVKKVAVDMVVLFTNKPKLLSKSQRTTRLVVG